MKKYTTIAAFAVVCLVVFFLQFQYKKTYQPHTYYQVYLDEDIVGVIKSKEQLEEHISKQGTLIKNQIIEYRETLEILNGIDSIISNKVKRYANKDAYLEMMSNYDKLAKLVDQNGNFSSDNKEEVEDILSELSFSNVRVLEDSIRNYASFFSQLEEEFLNQKNTIMDYIQENRDSLSLSETEKYYLDEYVSKKMENISYVKQVYMADYVEKNEAYEYADNVYSPIGISIEKINTYDADLSPVDEVYQQIVEEKPCTIEGYQFRIKKQENEIISKYAAVGALFLEGPSYLLTPQSEDVIIYVTDEKIFREAVEKLEIVFVGTEEYTKYANGTQSEIVDTGAKIEDVYVLENITIKQTNISVGEKIYNDSDELSSYLLYGDNKSVKTVYASATDDVLSLAYENGISVEEFFLSNPSFTSIYNIFYDKQPIIIAQTNPQISIVVEQFKVEDMEVAYETEEKYDSNLNMGTRYVSQKGETGMERVSQSVQSVNGAITYVKPISNVTMKNAKNEIVLIGTKAIPSVGSLASWHWPTNSGYRITSYFGYRTSPINGGRELHSGIDIAGTGYGSPVRAANNGTIEIIDDLGNRSYGKYIMINHNNGYYTLYGHMSGWASGLTEDSIVERGQVIGYVGSTGWATGPHLHFEVRTCQKYSCVTNPLPYLEKR